MPEVRVELNITGIIGAVADYPDDGGYYLTYKGVKITNGAGQWGGTNPYQWNTPEGGFGGTFDLSTPELSYPTVSSSVILNASIGRVVSESDFLQELQSGAIPPLQGYDRYLDNYVGRLQSGATPPTALFDEALSDPFIPTDQQMLTAAGPYAAFDLGFQSGDYQTSYYSHAWQLLNVGVTTADKQEWGSISITEGADGSVTTPTTKPSPIRFTDVDPNQGPSATYAPTIPPTAATSTGLALPVSAGLIAAVEAGFSLGDVTYANGSGSVGWTFDPSALNAAPYKVAPNEILDLKETVTVNDTTDAPDTATVDVTISGPDHIPEYDDAALKRLDIFNKFLGAVDNIEIGNTAHAIDGLLAYQTASHVDSQLNQQLAAAGDDKAAQYLAYENAAVSVPEAAIKLAVTSLVGLLVVEFGLAGATLVAAPVVGVGVAGAVLTGAALDAVGISAAAEVTTALVGTALTPAITQFVAKVGIGFALDAAYDATLKDPVDSYLRGLFEQEVPFDSFQEWKQIQDSPPQQDPQSNDPLPPPATTNPTSPSTPPTQPRVSIPPQGSNPNPGDPGSTIGSGVTIVAAGGQTTTGVTVAQNGALHIAAGAILQDATIAGGLVEIEAGAIAYGQVSFSGPGGRLEIDDTTGVTPIISGFAPGDVINLNDVPFDPNGTATLLSGNMLDVAENGSDRFITLDPTEDFTGKQFVLSDPTGTDVTVQDAPVCFCTGTRILTTRGEIAVDNLRVGDVAVVASGERRLVRWIGHRYLGAPNGELSFEQWPVRVLENAFGPALPARTLYLSPGHPVLVGADESGEGGHLVPIMCLVNGTTIEREPRDSVTYWHVELDVHDILLAEGLPAESYLDGGDRDFFTEAANHALLNPDFVVPGLGTRCRPVAVDGPVVDAERCRLDTVFALRLASHCAWPSTGDLALKF